MSAPRTKRQFAGAASDPAQRQIKDFFKPAPASGTPSHTPSTATHTSGPLSPPLPGAVQANLLSVGMRVRKSVPEGYKTGDKCSGFSLWSDNSVPGGQPQPSSAGDFSLPTFTPQSSSIPSFSPTGRELLPFCGINKVGGLAVQPDAAPIPPAFFASAALDQPTISLTPAAAAVPELDDVPGLTSSQDSVLSTSSSPAAAPVRTNNKKRFYTAEDTTTTSLPIPVAENGGGITWRDRRDWLDGEVSPRSLAPVGWEKNARVMAVPRGVMRKTAGAGPGAAGSATGDAGQENRVVGIAVVDDFEEAEFLEDHMEVEE
ncbi:ribonucleotide reductase inhibitor-domain-containing protein [Coniochaeta sp. 2T2.1]|nr:ribonucleotide reductase inhibitor-domain-containing protein [Coniochaeta sp. 2T2.1]